MSHAPQWRWTTQDWSRAMRNFARHVLVGGNSRTNVELYVLRPLPCASRAWEVFAHHPKSLGSPNVCTSTYAFDDTRALVDHNEGRIEDREYGR